MRWSVKECWRYAWAHSGFSGTKAVIGLFLAIPTFLVLGKLWNTETAWQEVVAILVAVIGTEITLPVSTFTLNSIRAADNLTIERLAAQDKPDSVVETIRRLKQKTFVFEGRELDAAEILHRISRDLASGLPFALGWGGDARICERLGLDGRYEMQPVLDELWIEGLLRQEERHGWSSDPASFHNAPYQVLFLSQHGANVVRRLDVDS